MTITTGTHTIRDHIAALERRLARVSPRRLAAIERPIGLYTPVPDCIDYAFALDQSVRSAETAPTSLVMGPVETLARALARAYWRGYWTHALGRGPGRRLLRRYVAESHARFQSEARRLLGSLEEASSAGEDVAGDSPAPVPPARGVSRPRPPAGGQAHPA